ncbi:MAG: aminotransferase class I/II-fold pyridoxal phosphate-dependent enzyme, partial [Bryocella sp.]
MINKNFVASLQSSVQKLKDENVYKRLNYLQTAQSAHVKMEGRGDVLILSSNNYLGMCDEPDVVDAGIKGLQTFGAGTGSVRFICGTFTIHRDLEAALAKFVGTEAAL